MPSTTRSLIPAANALEIEGESKPVWFELNRRQHKIACTTYYWKDKLGDAPLLHFAVVTEDDSLYELVFNALDQTWMLYPQKSE